MMSDLSAIAVPLGSLLILGIGSIVISRVGLAKRPTKEEVDRRYVNKDVCKVLHKQVDEKLHCIPDIKDDVTKCKTMLEFLVQEKTGG